MENSLVTFSKHLKVLVVEDDVVSRILLNEILKQFSLTVLFARNGQEAVDMVKADSSFDLILMDLKMPIMNGYEATEKIRDLGFTNPIIAQTAYASTDDKSKVSVGGPNGYLSKPINKNSLLEILQTIKGK